MTRTLQTAGRVIGAGMVGATAGIHAHLWLDGYRQIPTIGPMFLLNVIGGSLLVLALLGTPRRFLPFVAVGGAGYEAVTLGALWLSTTHGLFGFVESSAAPLYWPSVAIEAIGAVVLLVLAASALAGPRRLISQRHAHAA